MDKENYSHLLANPSYMKKKDKTNVDYDIILQEELIVILNKLFPDYHMNEYNHNLIFKKIEKLCRNLYIDQIISNIVDTIINDIIKDEEIQRFSIEEINE